MSVLRIFLAGDEACDWTLLDHEAAGGEGLGGPSPAAIGYGESTGYAELPRAAQCVAIVPAARMRTLTVAVPPTPATKLLAVVRFALEDQLAGDIESQHVVIAARREQNVIVHVLDRRWLRNALTDIARHGVQPARVVAESDLAPRAVDGFGTWLWRKDGGFLLETGGRVTALDQSRDALPSGLLLALRSFANTPGARAESARVIVRGPSGLAVHTPAWSRATGATFEIAPEWTWRDAPASTLAGAANLLTPELHAGIASAAAGKVRPRLMRLAAMWLLAALLLHVGASATEWGMLKWRVANVERDLHRLILGMAPDLAGDLDIEWRRHYAAARHRQGKAAPDDALPLLAESAAALPDLPAGALRVINFETGQLTLDFDRSATLAVAAALPVWRERGFSVLQAESPGGLRVRFTQR